MSSVSLGRRAIWPSGHVRGMRNQYRGPSWTECESGSCFAVHVAFALPITARRSSKRAGSPARRFLTLAGRGFPEQFVRHRRIGYAPVSSSRDLPVHQVRGPAKSNGTQVLREAVGAGLAVQDRAGGVRDFFASETCAYNLFPNVVHGHVVDLQGRIPRPRARDSPAGHPTGPPTDPDVRISRIRLFKTIPLRTNRYPPHHTRVGKWIPPQEVDVRRPRETPTL